MATILVAFLREGELAESGIFRSVAIGIKEGGFGETPGVATVSSRVGSDHHLGRNCDRSVLIRSGENSENLRRHTRGEGKSKKGRIPLGSGS